MNEKNTTPLRAGWARWFALGAFALATSGCSYLPQVSNILPSFLGGSAEKPKPAELQPNPNLLALRQAWTARVGAIHYPLNVNVTGSTVTLASDDGAITALDAVSGRELWRANAGQPLAAGVGSDGKVTAVVTRTNEVIAFENGKETWRYKLPAQGYTAPFVAGGRVFVLAGDRSVTALDGQKGTRLWVQSRPGEPLVLRQGGVILAVGDQLVVGQGGRLVALNPINGGIRWEVALATPRGINDVERLVDLVGRVSREGDVVCARAFQASVGCVNAARGQLLWTQKAAGSEGIHGDAANVFGAEADGKVMAWRRDTGQRAWMVDSLAHRGLTAPLVLGRSVVVGDAYGFVHLLSRENGSLLNRVATDGSAIAAAPVVAGNNMIVVTQNGGVYAFAPQ